MSFALLLIALSAGPTQAGPPSDLPVLAARSPVLDVVDDGHLRKGLWFADPSVALDVYTARRSSRRRTIEFRSDLGALSFELGPGEAVDFTIELEDGARCPTRISTARTGASSTGDGSRSLPFRVAEDGKIHVQGRIGSSESLDLMFDTGADTVVLYPSGRAKVPDLVLDGQIANQGFGGQAVRPTSSDNVVRLGDLVFPHEQVLVVDRQVEPADGILGWVLFEDHVLDVDPARGTIEVLDDLPEDTSPHARLPLEYHGTLPHLVVTLDLGDERVQGLVVLDTGSSASLHLSADFADAHGLREALPGLGTSRSGGIGGNRITNDVVRLPGLALGPLEVHDVPVHLARAGGAPPSAVGTLGMDVLSRFHLLLDSRGDALWLRPGPDHERAFRRDYLPTGVLRGLIAGAATVLIVITLALRRLLRKRRTRGLTGQGSP